MDEITQYWSVLRRRWLPASTGFTAIVATTALATFAQKPIYEAKGQILLKKTNSTSSLLGAQGIGELDSLANSSNPANTQAELIRSIPVAQETIASLNLSGDLNSFLQTLKVTNIKSTDILQVSYQSTEPDQAAKIINTVMGIYVKNDIIAQRSEAKAAREFVENQLPKIEDNVQHAEHELRRFKEQNQVIDLESEASSATRAITEVNQQLASSQAQLGSAAARLQKYKQLFSKDLNPTINTAAVAESITVQKALSDLHETQQKLALERIRFQEQHPIIVQLKIKEAALQDLLNEQSQQNIIGTQPTPNKFAAIPSQGVQATLIKEFANAQTERNSLQQQVHALAQVEASYRQRMYSLPKLEQQQRELERKLKAAQSTYEILLAKLQEIRVTENQNVGNARIVASALTPPEPIAPKKALNLAAGGILGILVGGATALALEALDKTIKSVDDAKQLLNYPLLGIIPQFEKIEGVTVRFGNQKQLVPGIVVTNTTSSPVSEAFRMLHTNLRYMSLDNQLKVIVVSSSLPQEGKSTTAANLAVAVAQLGRRVLVVDADMRKPYQHQIWQISNQVGLSNVLTGQSEFSNAVVKVMDNLEVLPAGVTPPNPLLLLDSTQMAVLVGQWAQSYDFVIIDTPPLTVAADTTILCRMANGLVFVVRPGVADVGRIHYCKEILEQSGQNVLGLVVNGINKSNSNYYYSNYYYAKSKNENIEAGKTV